MRIPPLIVCALAMLVLGAYQAIAAIALHERATDASVWHALGPALSPVVGGLQPSGAQPQELRRVLLAFALARGDVARADRFVATLGPGAERARLVGAIAQARGDDAAAVRAYLASGDLGAIALRVDALAAGGRLDAAVALQARVVARLEQTHAQNDTIAQALYGAGVVLQRRAYADVDGSAAREADEARSVASYEGAVELAPLEDRYRIALANEYLNARDLAAARAEFERVRALDPTSVEAYTGLADAAIRANDRAAAMRYLAAARAFAPNAPAIAAMAEKLEH